MTPTDHKFWDIIRDNYTPDEVIALDRKFYTTDQAIAGDMGVGKDWQPSDYARKKWLDELGNTYVDGDDGA